MDRDIEGWSLTARRLLRRLRHPSALEVDPEGIALRDALGTSTVFDAVSVSAERALAHADPRLLRIVQQCDFGDTTMKVQAHELHVSLRHVFRFRMKVFAALGIEMKRAIERRTALPRDASRAEAARLMARAQFLVARRGAGDDVRSIALAEQALAADPTRADAWCLIASANISLSLLGQLDADVGQARARAALACAEDLGTSRGVVLAIRSNMASTWSHEWSLAKSLACEAIETPDGAAGGHHTLVWVALHERAYEDAERHASAASLAAPGRWLYHQLSAAIVHLRGDFARAVESCAGLHALAPEDSFVLGYLAEALNAVGRFRDTIDVVNAAPAVAKDFSVLTALACAHALRGDRATARRLARSMRTPAVSTAAVSLALGEEDAAWVALERAVQERNGMLELTQYDPMFQPFWHEPRYQRLVS